MKTALVISSFVAASRVGATASAFCLRRLGVETLVLPTTVLGRHPGWGDPGGNALTADHLLDMWVAVKKQTPTIDAVMTGYFAADDHINVAAEIISDVKADNPDVIILVDPVMGDNGRLYVPETRAMAIKDILLPLADIITPNVWELSFLTGRKIETRNDVIKAVDHLRAASLVTSVPRGDKIGALYSDKARPLFVSHEKFDSVPHGGGDSLAATFLAHQLNGRTETDSLSASVASIFEILSAAVESDAGELPLIREQHALISPKPLTVEIL